MNYSWKPVEACEGNNIQILAGGSKETNVIFIEKIIVGIYLEHSFLSPYLLFFHLLKVLYISLPWRRKVRLAYCCLHILYNSGVHGEGFTLHFSMLPGYGNVTVEFDCRLLGQQDTNIWSVKHLGCKSLFFIRISGVGVHFALVYRQQTFGKMDV